MNYTVGLDLGTTNCKAIALGDDGNILCSTSSSYQLRFPHAGWVEQDPDEVWLAVQNSLRSLNITSLPGDFIGICISGAMHSVLPINANNQALAPAMTWADQRASVQADKLRKIVDLSSIYNRTGCPLNTIYHCPKILWWFEEAPQIARQTEKFVAIKDYILFQLTGRWVTDRGLASTTGLLNIHLGEWDQELLKLARINNSTLPTLTWATDSIGKLSKNGAVSSSLPEHTNVIIGTHDGGLANIGAGAFSFNQKVITVGTSGAVRQFVEKPALDNLQRTWCYLTLRNQWLVGGAINNGGLAVEWIRERFYSSYLQVNGYAKLFKEASYILPGADGLLFLPYFTGERSPYFDPAIRGAIFGLSLHHQRAHLARAALEGVAFCIADVYLALLSAQSPKTEENETMLLTGGITQSSVWMQILTDILGTNLTSVDVADASAIGAAMLAHQALGSKSFSQLASAIPLGISLTPDSKNHEFYQKLHQKYLDQVAVIRANDSSIIPRFSKFPQTQTKV